MEGKATATEFLLFPTFDQRNVAKIKEQTGLGTTSFIIIIY
jgi:hypothetical protein